MYHHHMFMFRIMVPEPGYIILFHFRKTNSFPHLYINSSFLSSFHQPVLNILYFSLHNTFSITSTCQSVVQAKSSAKVDVVIHAVTHVVVHVVALVVAVVHAAVLVVDVVHVATRAATHVVLHVVYARKPPSPKQSATDQSSKLSRRLSAAKHVHECAAANLNIFFF